SKKEGESNSHPLAAQGPTIHAFASLTVPEWRDTLRFRTKNGFLRNVLAKEVPEQAAFAIKKIATRLLTTAELEAAEIQHWIFHSGGKKILDAIQQSLDLLPESLSASRKILEDFGNMSSPTVFFVMDEENRIRPPQEGEWGFLSSFGAGFSAHAVLLRY